MDAALLISAAIAVAGIVIVRRAQSPPAASLGILLFGVGAVALITGLVEIVSAGL